MSRPNIVNSYATSLNGSITNSATTLTVNDNVPSDLVAPFKCRIVAEGSNTNEIITVTAISGTGNKTWTISRATESWNGVTAASAHANNAVVEHNFTAQTLIESQGLVFLEEHTASSSATLDFTSISSTYDTYEIVFKGVYSGGQIPAMTVSVNGGSTWASTNYMWSQWIWGNGTAQYHSDSDVAWNLVNFTDVSPDAARAINGTLRLFLPSAGYAMLNGLLTWGRTADGSLHAAACMFSGRYDSATNPNAIRFLYGSGNITAGTIRLYGISKI